MLTDILASIVYDHEPVHVAVALAICFAGSLVSVRLLRTLARTGPAQRPYWVALLAIIAGGTVWTTHFIAILGYRPDLLSGHDQRLVALSLFAAIAGMLVALSVQVSLPPRIAPLAAGTVFGLGGAAMHFIGMAGFAITCVSQSDPLAAGLGVGLGCLGGAAAFHCALRRPERHIAGGAAGLTAAVVLLHFGGMASITLDPSIRVPLPPGDFPGDGLGLPVLLVMGLVLFVGLSSLQLDRIAGREARASLHRAAREDPLTGLPNRRAFRETLETFGDQAGAVPPLLLIVVDIDRLSAINDTHGHDAGDEVLREIGRRLSDWLPLGAFAARIGGDEFCVALPGHVPSDQAGWYGASLIASLSRAVWWEGLPLKVQAGAGMILCPDHADTIEDLFAGAEIALTDAKGRGSNRAGLYNPEIARQQRERRDLGDALERALDEGGLDLHFQPQITLMTGHVVGFEALLRWQHPALGRISPEVFVPLAEERGRIEDLGNWVLRRALTEAAGWRRHCRIAINVAAPQFASGTLVATLRGLLAETGMAPHLVELEITETTVIEDLAAVREQIAEIKALGVGLAMDDYGTGFSALSTLLALPFDKIKFDKSFIETLTTDRRMVGVIRSTVELGRYLGLKVLAEGVETEEQVSLLTGLGCDEVQGFLIGKPMPAETARRLFDLDLSDAELWDRDRRDDALAAETRHGVGHVA